MINSISFKARYINSKTIENCCSDKDKATVDAAFVKLNPKSNKDREAIKLINSTWDNGNTYAKNILSEMEHATYSPSPVDFFALTSQMDDFENLNPNKILGVAQVKQEKPNELKLKYLQVDPANSHQAQNPNFKGIGAAIVNSIKEYFPSLNIALFSSRSAINFYIKQGFTSLEAGRGRMIFKR